MQVSYVLHHNFVVVKISIFNTFYINFQWKWCVVNALALIIVA